MTKRASVLTQLAGVIAIAGGALSSIASWAGTASEAGTARLFDFATAHTGVAFASDFATTLRADLTLPRLLLTEPFIWLGVGLVLTPTVYQRLKRHHAADDPAYAGYAYVECPECRHVVPMSAKRCPLCGADLFSPWANASRHA